MLPSRMVNSEVSSSMCGALVALQFYLRALLLLHAAAADDDDDDDDDDYGFFFFFFSSSSFLLFLTMHCRRC